MFQDKEQYLEDNRLLKEINLLLHWLNLHHSFIKEISLELTIPPFHLIKARTLSKAMPFINNKYIFAKALRVPLKGRQPSNRATVEKQCGHTSQNKREKHFPFF